MITSDQTIGPQMLLSPGAPIPDLNPLNAKLGMFIAVWKRLPLAVATRLGPSIVKGIG